VGAPGWRGPHVELRSPRPGDEAAFLAAVAASRSLHHPWVAPPATPEAWAQHVARYHRGDQFGYLAWAHDGTLAGVVNVNDVVWGASRSATLGWYAFAGATGRGLMTEALGGVLAVAFDDLGLHRLEANIQPGNEPSRRLAQRCGFVLEGLSRDYLFVDGRWRDHERWALVATWPRRGAVTVRRIGPDDAEAFRTLRLQALRDAPEAFDSSYEREVAFPSAEWTARLSRAATFVAEDAAGAWVGTATGLAGGPAVHLVGMWVTPAARRTGAGRLLVEAVVGWARGTGAREVHLTVVDGNTAAQELYGRTGFAPTGARSTRARDGAVEIDLARPLGR
jgi:ribosomal-protein-alanine N-acetyltransferase